MYKFFIIVITSIIMFFNMQPALTSAQTTEKELYIVQIGLYKKETSNAQKVYSILIKNNFPAHRTNCVKHTNIHIGYYKTKLEAEKALAEIRNIGMDGFVKKIISPIFATVPVSSPDIQKKLDFNIALNKITLANTTTLKGASDTYSFKLPIPKRWTIQEAILNFSYVNSIALIPNRSKMVVLLNEQPITQVTLNPVYPEGSIAVALPVDLLKVGYNDISFKVSQLSTNDCQDPSSPELWTTLKLDKASLDFAITMKDIPLTLSSVNDFLFDSKMFTENIVNIVIANLSENNIEAAVIAASGIALKFNYRPVKFTLSKTLKDGYDNIVIGNKNFISNITNHNSIDGQGAFLKISPMPNEPKHALIIIQGDSTENIKKATLAFSIIDYPFPKIQSMQIHEVNLSQIPPAAKKILLPEHEYSFCEMGVGTIHFNAVNKKASLKINLPSDAFLKPNLDATLSLNMVYGSGMRQDSVLNIHVNGKFMSSIHLNITQGATFEDYRINIPLDLLKSGHNEILFTAVLTPLIADLCTFIQTENLQLTIFDSSRFELPSFPLWVAMPDISLFFNDGFPFSQPLDFSNTVIYLAEKNIAVAAAAINLVAISTQKSGFHPSNISVTFNNYSNSEKNIIVVGSLSNISEKFLEVSPLQMVYYKDKGSFYSASVKYTGEFDGNWVMLSQFESPYKSQKTVLLFTSLTTDNLLEGAHILWEPTIQGRSTGGMVIFDTQYPDTIISSLNSNSIYYIGNLGLFTQLSALIYQYPIMFLLLIIFCLFILSILIYKKLITFKKNQR